MLAFSAALLITLSAAAPSYRLRILPVPQGCDSYNFLGHGLSESGAVIGNLQCGDSSTYQAVRWDDEGIHILPTLGGRSSYALGVSRDGSIVLGMADSPTAPDGQFVTRPVLWMEGTIVELETLGGQFGAAVEVDQRGSIVGTCEDEEIDPRVDRGPIRACRWTDGEASDLGGLGGPDAEALDVNKRGWVVGWATTTTPAPTADGLTHMAFLHDGSGMRALGTLGGEWSEAYGVNEAGEIVGYSDTDVTESGFREQHAFAWRRGIMRDLGSLAGGFAVAMDINARGDIVGTCRVPVPGERAPTVATLWRGSTIRNLNELVERLDGWALQEATAIDNTGRILVLAYRAGEFRVAILEPKRP